MKLRVPAGSARRTSSTSRVALARLALAAAVSPRLSLPRSPAPCRAAGSPPPVPASGRCRRRRRPPGRRGTGRRDRAAVGAARWCPAPAAGRRGRRKSAPATSRAPVGTAAAPCRAPRRRRAPARPWRRRRRRASPRVRRRPRPSRGYGARSGGTIRDRSRRGGDRAAFLPRAQIGSELHDRAVALLRRLAQRLRDDRGRGRRAARRAARAARRCCIGGGSTSQTTRIASSVDRPCST